MPPPFFCCVHPPSALSYMPSLIIAGVSFPSSTAILRDDGGSRRFVLMSGSTSLIIIYTHPTLQEFTAQMRGEADSSDTPARASAADRVHARGAGATLIAEGVHSFHSIR